MEKLPQRTVILMRHAKSDWKANLVDIDRPLNARGEGDALKMASFLTTKLSGPVKVVSSTARRSRDTARTLVNALPQATLVVEDLLYLASPCALFKLIEDNDSEECLVLVGHNPGLEELVEYVDPDLLSRAGIRKIFPTCAVYAYLVSNSAKDGPKDRQRKADWDFRYLFHQRPKDLD